MQNKNFEDIYDLVNQQKGYTEEVEYIISLFMKYSNDKLTNVLDVGCGTGNHSIEFVKKNYKVVGLDIDPEMLEKAKNKVNDPNSCTFILADIKEYQSDIKFDLVFSWFFVINYISSLDYLIDFFKAINQNLNVDGIYIFDCWNGNATLLDHPKIKEFFLEKSDPKISISGILTPEYDEILNKSVFNYIFDVKENNIDYQIQKKLYQTYWSIYTLLEILRISGFSNVKIKKCLSFDEKISNNDYKLTFVCKK